jgi:hypothetical protein
MPKTITASFRVFFILLSVACAYSPRVAAQPAQGPVAPSNFTGQVTGLSYVRTLSFRSAEAGLGGTKLVFDDRFAYLSTPDGLFRAARPFGAASPLTLIGFAGQRIHNLYVQDNVLYVLKEGGDASSASLNVHSFLKSVDHGQSFVPLDEGLKSCYAGFCEYLYVTQAAFRDGVIFLTGGGGNNLFVSNDEGKHWKVLSGFLERQACYDGSFEIVGNTVLQGGECPLDFAYISAGTLRPDMLGWTDTGSPRQIMGVEELGNRNVQFIARSPNTPFVFAGVEGGLLKSYDLSQSFHFVIEHPVSGGSGYPYVHRVLLNSRYKDFILVGGFDKPNARGYLAYSRDHGESWTDISDLILAPEIAAYNVAFLAEDPDGRVLIGTRNESGKQVTIAELLITAPPTLLTEGDSARALALDSVTLMSAPFPPTGEHNFSADRRTRVSLFATNVWLRPGESLSVITARAEDSRHVSYQLPVESVGRTPGFPWLTQVVVKLPTELAGAGDVRVSISVRGVVSNEVLLATK